MAEPPQPRATEEHTHMADLPCYPGIPRWVKVSGIIAIVLVLLFVIMYFTGVGGKHGPGHHMMGMMGRKVSAALVATYRPVMLVATHRPVVLAATYRPRQSPSGHVPSRTRWSRQRAKATFQTSSASMPQPLANPPSVERWAFTLPTKARLGMGPAGEGLR